MSEEIKKILDDHEKRLQKMEDILFSKEDQKIKPTPKGYKGLGGGIRFLIDNGFLNEPKTANEIMEELKREGYHHSISSISKMLSINFTKNKKILNRIKEDDSWKYVLRK